eukprot:8929915-Pyramimonas_sp.AAC.1
MSSNLSDLATRGVPLLQELQNPQPQPPDTPTLGAQGPTLAVEDPAQLLRNGDGRLGRVHWQAHTFKGFSSCVQHLTRPLGPRAEGDEVVDVG